MTISNKRDSNHLPLTFNGIIIAESPTINILGVTIDRKLNWTSHINTVATRAGQRLGILRRVSHLLTPQSLSTIYKAQVRSVMEYSPLAWMSAAPTTLKKLDTIQDKAGRLIGTPSTTGALWLQCVPSTRCTAATRQSSFNSTFQSRDLYHLEGQGQQRHGNSTTYKFPSKPHTILTWTCIAAPSLSLGQNPGTPFLTTLWVYLHHIDCSGSRRRLTTIFSRAIRDGH